MRVLLLISSLLCTASAALGAQIPDRLIGTWKMDLNKSQWERGTSPYRSWISKIEPAAEGYRVTTDWVDSQGQPGHSEMIWRSDGSESPILGASGVRTMQYQRIDEFTFQYVLRIDGVVAATSRGVITADGKTRVNTVTGRSARGETFRNVEVYEKQ